MKYNHAYTIAFSLNSGREDGHVTGQELRKAIVDRLTDLCDDELVEACGVPYDTYENAPPTCAERAAWAESAVTVYAQAKEGRAYDPVADMASDLFTDLCHLFLREGVSPEQMMERARTHHQEERAEEGRKI